jgi:hypothetical protein
MQAEVAARLAAEESEKRALKAAAKQVRQAVQHDACGRQVPCCDASPCLDLGLAVACAITSQAHIHGT